MKIIITRKKIKNIIFKINIDKTISISAPYFISENKLNEIIERKDEWIKKKLKEIGEKPPIEYCFYYFLGKKIPLHNSSKKDIEIYLKKEAPFIIEPIIKKYLKLTNLNIKHSSYKFMRTRWGSCNTTKKYLNFNILLLGSSLDSIEYIVLHEIAHLKYPHHQESFWNYISFYMPDWKIRKNKLINSIFG
ncbi:MAG: M48 family metallopeptidase [Fusobacteriaceae bacterium]